MWEEGNGEVKNLESPASLQEHAWLDTLIATNYQDVSTLAVQDQRWFPCLKESLFTESLKHKHHMTGISLPCSHPICTLMPNLHSSPTHPDQGDLLLQIHRRASTHYPPTQSLVSTPVRGQEPADTTLCMAPQVFRQPLSFLLFYLQGTWQHTSCCLH
jgi:hypothetical protein